MKEVQRKDLIPIVRDVRKAFFNTIASLFINYQDSIVTVPNIGQEFSIKTFKIKSETEKNKQFYRRFFGDHPLHVQNQLFTNFINQIIDGSMDENAVLRKERFDQEISTIMKKTGEGKEVNFINEATEEVRDLLNKHDKHEENTPDIEEVTDDEHELAEGAEGH